MIMWVARDKDGKLFLYEEPPYKTGDFNDCWIKKGGFMHQIASSYFPEVKWEDEEPRELILK